MIGGGALLALVGAGAWYLTREGTQIKFDESKHTRDKLLLIINDLYIEYACSYIFIHNLMMRMKADGQLNPDMMENIKARMEVMTDEKDKEVAKLHGIDTDFLEQWLKKYQNDPDIKEFNSKVMDLYKQVTEGRDLEKLGFELTEGFTKESYMQVLRKFFAALRHAAYPLFQKELKDTGKDVLTVEDQNVLVDTIE